MVTDLVEQPHAKSDPDAELVRDTLSGDLGAFEQLVQRHRAVVHRIAARVVGRDEADDVVQETFLRAYHRLDHFRGESAFRSWLLRIASNSALNAARRKDPVPVETITEPDGELAPVAHGGPVSRLEERERRERLELKLGGLRREHRIVLVLRDLEGFSYEEIAEATESPVGSVKGRLHRARNELIELMRANTYDWGLPHER
jgi:RNA polymerase sigma-70 factor (ECF subfamily)